MCALVAIEPAVQVITERMLLPPPVLMAVRPAGTMSPVITLVAAAGPAFATVIDSENVELHGAEWVARRPRWLLSGRLMIWLLRVGFLKTIPSGLRPITREKSLACREQFRRGMKQQFADELSESVIREEEQPIVRLGEDFQLFVMIFRSEPVSMVAHHPDRKHKIP